MAVAATSDGSGVLSVGARDARGDARKSKLGTDAIEEENVQRQFPEEAV